MIIVQQFLFVFYKYGSSYYRFALLLYFVLFSDLRILLQAAQDQTRGDDVTFLQGQRPEESNQQEDEPYW